MFLFRTGVVNTQRSSCTPLIRKSGLSLSNLTTTSFFFSMSSTSQKHRNFVAEPMGEKLVTELAGIGPVLGERLTEKGFDKAYVVLGQFLLLKKDQEMFMEWIKDTCAANKKQGSDCHNCLKEWCDAFL